MSSSICFIPSIYHDWENMGINKFNFLLTKEIQFFYTCNFVPSSCHTYDNRTPKRPVIKDNACEFRPSKLKMACVCARARAIHVIHGQASIMEYYSEKFTILPLWVEDME